MLNRDGSVDRLSRRAKRDQGAVTRALDNDPAVLLRGAGDNVIVLSAEGVAGVVAEARTLFRGADEVSETHRPHAAVERHAANVRRRPGPSSYAGTHIL